MVGLAECCAGGRAFVEGRLDRLIVAKRRPAVYGSNGALNGGVTGAEVLQRIEGEIDCRFKRFRRAAARSKARGADVVELCGKAFIEIATNAKLKKLFST